MNSNNKSQVLEAVTDICLECCATQIDEQGTMSVTKDDLLGRTRVANANMTRCILITELLFMGFSVTTIAQYLHRTEQSIRHLLDSAHQYRLSSYAYRVAEAEATLKCKEIINSD